MMQAEFIKEAVLSLLYPRRCPVCDEIVTKGMLIHPKCQKTVKYVGKNTCLKCGRPISDDTTEFCADCKKTEHCFDRGFSLFKYRSISGSVYKFKYSGRREYADYYAMEMERILGDDIKSLGADVIIPIPMYRTKERKRGYNQAQVLAKAVGKRLGIPVDKRVVSRVKNTVPMKLLDQRARRANLKKAFNITRNEVKYSCIILIDDIYTTGSTMDAVAKMFRDKGARKIYCLTLAIGHVV